MATYVADGTVIKRSDGDSPANWTTIPQVTSIGTVGQDRGLIDVTNLASSAREYKKAIADGQELALVLQYDPDDTTHAALRTDLTGETAVEFQITLTDPSPQVISFFALVTNWTITNVEIDNVLTLNVTLKPTGDLSFN